MGTGVGGTIPHYRGGGRGEGGGGRGEEGGGKYERGMKENR